MPNPSAASTSTKPDFASPKTMRLRTWGLPLASIVACYAAASTTPEIPHPCAGRGSDRQEKCEEPLKPVTPVVPGSFYVAKLPCLGCPVAHLSDGNKEILHTENHLLFNLSLSSDSRTLYLNHKPILPVLSTDPTPPTLTTPQIAPNFTRHDLDDWIQCALDGCDGTHCSCMNSFASDRYLSEINLDYDYYLHPLEPHKDDAAKQWEITFDAIGGRDILPKDPAWQANDTSQSMLRIVVQGRELENNADNPHNPAGGGSLFETPDEPAAIVYEYELVSVDLSERSHQFEAPASLGFFGRLRRYFGLDIIRPDGHIVYLQEEWADYGKEGSLRNQVGYFVHEWPWRGIFTIMGSSLGGLVVLWLVYKLVIMAKRQHELARWDGIDTVWENLRRDSNNDDNEEDGLLSGGGYRDTGYSDADSHGEGSGRYRDESDEEGSVLYSDEALANKPLPTKPLPEKPLPAVPLIDA